MNIQINQRKAALTLAAIALGFGSAFLIDSIGDARFLPKLFSSAQAAEGHDSGGHTGGKGGSKGGHDTGGHDSESSHGGTEEKGHGTKMQHKGHSSGQHGSGSSHGGSERFGGGSGLRGNAQVPEGIGRYGEGAQAVTEGRTRYWGGWTLPEGPDDPVTDPVASTADVVPGSGGGPLTNVRNILDGPSRCEGVSSGMTPAEQFSGNNLLRLNAARGLVDSELASSGKIAPPFVMGSLQQELLKQSPNPDLAGTYLGLVAKSPVTVDTVKKIGAQLCSRLSDAQASEIANVAEAQRATLVSAAEAGK